MKYFLLLITLVGSSLISSAQLRVKGTVKNDDGKNLAGASVVLYYPGSTDSLKTVTNEKGAFTFNNVKKAKVEVITSFVGFKKLLSYYDYTEQTGEQNIWDIVLSPGDVTLETVTVEAAKIQIKEDTISYRIDSTMYRKNDNVEEVLKKLPGIEVDNKTGKVTAQGKEVTKVKVNGKDFFGGDVTTATRELNADMVDKIQVIDDYGDQAAFTGVRDGEASKTLNIQLKKDKNKGYFGNVSAGIGTEDRYQAGLSLNIFNNERQISILGNINNTNASTFNFGGNAMMAGIASSMGIGRGGAGAGSAFGNFGTSNGLNVTKSVGVNFRDQWGPKVSAYGSYSFSNRQSTTLQNVSRKNNIVNPNINLENNNDYAVNDNHRISFNIEYKIDSFNYLKFSPNVSITNTNGENFSDFDISRLNGDKISEGTINSFSDSKSPNINGSLLFNHRFKKRGRTLSLNLSASDGYTESMNDYDNYTSYYFPLYRSDTTLQYITQDNDNRSTSLRASYIEPLSKTKSLEFNYSYTRQVTGNDRKSYEVDPVTGNKTYQDSLSNIFDNVYITNRIGANFRNTQKKYNYSLGFAVQPASIESNSITGKYSYKRNIFNYYPVFRYQYNFSKSRSFSVNYSGSTKQPSYSQLQPVYDSTNLQYITVGNPDLRPEFSNNLGLRYNNFDFISGNVFFGSINASFTNDKIVNNAIDLGADPTDPKYRPGAQEIRYLNADGYYALSAFYNFSRPIQNRKYVFNFGGNASFNNNIAYLDGQKTTGKNFILGQRFSMDYKLKKWLESNIAVNFVFNDAQNAGNKSASSTTRAWTLSNNSRIFFPKGIVFTYDINKTLNSGYGEGVNTDPFIINAALEKQFFKSKKLSLKLNALDMLNENTSISRTVNSYYITDTRTNRLGRYYMLSAIFRLNKFSGQAPQQRRVIMGGPPM
jgi:hypothetical protein